PPSCAVEVFECTQVGHGTSSALTQAAESAASTHEVIWCDLESIATVDSLCTYLHNRFRRFDPRMPPFAIVPDPLDHGEKPSPDRRVDWIVEAMGRGKYVLAVDSVGEFGLSYWKYGALAPHRLPDRNWDARPEALVRERQRLLRLVADLAQQQKDFGESKL